MSVETKINKSERYGWSETPEVKSRLEWLKIGLLHVDHLYQRQKLEEKQVLAIARNFNWACFGAITVQKRNGIYYVTDGQHRLEAVKRRGDIISVPCSVTESLGVEYEALSFCGINSNRKAVSAYDKYQAMLTAKDPIYLCVEKMLSEKGLKIAQNSSVFTVAFPAQIVTNMKTDPERCAIALDMQRVMIGYDDNLHMDIHKGLFYLLQKVSVARIHEPASKVFPRGGKPLLLQHINRICIEGACQASEKVCAVGVASVLNYRSRNPIKL